MTQHLLHLVEAIDGGYVPPPDSLSFGQWRALGALRRRSKVL